ncbi:hypothetical protein AAFC00_000433 [Neodothiora populina]|uniref:Large ribosomal subunit protein bL27m n=1 Tax=Neodothiora populina TaxID=2781224 RepID=A0ABR3PCV7_9PEZI
MLLLRLRSALAGAPQPCVSTIETALSNLRVSSPPIRLSKPVTAVRNSTSLAQGRANGAKDGAGKRLGAKKSGEQYVIPGNIIFRQRGTHWFPGDNVGMGRDHTIYATQAGYVKYYKDPLRHPKRQYIGVVFERSQTLPQPPNAVRRRKLGMLAYQMAETAENVVAEKQSIVGQKAVATLRPGYQYRQANWEIGRAAERANIQVEPFKPGDRFAAWRKTAIRKAKNAERRGLGGRKR